MIQQQSIKPASTIGSCLYIGQDRFGRWVVRDAQCLCGGLFANQTEAIRFAMYECQRRPQSVITTGPFFRRASIRAHPRRLAGFRIAELAIDKPAQTLLMPVSARRQLNDLPDEQWTKISIEFYKDGTDAVFNALVE